MSTTSFCGVELVWSDFYWAGEYRLGDSIELQVSSEDEQPVLPCIRQERAWNSFVENYGAIDAEILNAVFSYYIEMRPKYESMGSEWIENMPAINGPMDIKGMIMLNSISISWPYDSSTVRFGLSYSCTWEQEHGLGVVLAGAEIIKVGGADCAIV